MFQKRIEELRRLIQMQQVTTKDGMMPEKEALPLFHRYLQTVKKKEGAVYVIGNGGSAGIASHFSIDLLNCLGIRAHTLYDSNTMTCISNDYGYPEVFSRPLTILFREEDLLVAISSSGGSKNILNAALLAKRKKIPLITLSGFDPKNPLRSLGDLNFYLGISDYGLVETGHFFLLHTIIDSWKFSLSSDEQGKEPLAAAYAK